MKKILSVFSFAVCVIFFSCKKNSTPPDPSAAFIGLWSGNFGLDPTNMFDKSTFKIKSDLSFDYTTYTSSGSVSTTGTGTLTLSGQTVKGPISIASVGSGFLKLILSSDNKKLEGGISGVENGPFVYYLSYTKQ